MKIELRIIEEYLRTPADRAEFVKSLLGLAGTLGLWVVVGVLLWALQ